MSEKGYTFDALEGIKIRDERSEISEREEVSLPEITQADLENNVLPKFLDMARSAGVTEDEHKRYEA